VIVSSFDKRFASAISDSIDIKTILYIIIIFY